MRLDEALSDLQCIQGHLQRAELAPCCRSATIALSGCLGIVAAGIQSVVLGTAAVTAETFVIYWSVVAAVSMVVVGGEMAWRYIAMSTAIGRRHTRNTLADFLPSLGIGASLTLLVLTHAPQHAPLLPALWSVMVGHGAWASRQRLPPAAVWVAVHYWVAGMMVARFGSSEAAFQPWTMALTFGVGQWIAAVVLYRTQGALHVGDK